MSYVGSPTEERMNKIIAFVKIKYPLCEAVSWSHDFSRLFLLSTKGWRFEISKNELNILAL